MNYTQWEYKSYKINHKLIKQIKENFSRSRRKLQCRQANLGREYEETEGRPERELGREMCNLCAEQKLISRK